MSRIILAFAASLLFLSLWMTGTARAADGEPSARRADTVVRPVDPVSGIVDTGMIFGSRVYMDMLVVELRGNIKRALEEADFHESPGLHRYTSATAHSSERGSAWLGKQLDSMTTYAEVNVLSRPHVKALLDQSTEIQICPAPPQIEYLVRTGKKTFELREAVAEPELGVTVNLTARAVADESDQIEISPLKISITTLDGREPISGVGLDVGKPIISTRRLETSITLADGRETIGIVLPGPSGRHAVLFLRVRRVREEGRQILPNPVGEPSSLPAASPKPNP